MFTKKRFVAVFCAVGVGATLLLAAPATASDGAGRLSSAANSVSHQADGLPEVELPATMTDEEMQSLLASADGTLTFSSGGVSARAAGDRCLIFPGDMWKRKSGSVYNTAQSGPSPDWETARVALSRRSWRATYIRTADKAGPRWPDRSTATAPEIWNRSLSSTCARAPERTRFRSSALGPAPIRAGKARSELTRRALFP